MSETVIRVENLSKRYRLGAKESLPKTRRDAISSLLGAPFKYLRSMVQEPQPEEVFWALKEVSFEVKAGEVVGVIGRNGAGKSTLLKILSRITKPSSGYAEIRGRVGSLLEVGTGFHPELTGRENIYLNGAILGMRRWEIDKKFDEIVAFAEIDRFLDTPVKRYSSGMYVRLAFAVAAHLEPEILVVDEVLAVGDAEFQKKCLGKMEDVAAKEGKTILFVSHSMNVITRICQKCIYLKCGQIIYYGLAEQAVSQYLSCHSNELNTYNKYEWKGDEGDDSIRLKKTWICSRSPSDHLHTAIEIEIGIEVEVLQKIEGLILGFRLFSETNSELAYVLYDDQKTSLPETIKPQKMINRFIIPPNTLAQGNYWIGFAIGIHNVKTIILNTHGNLSFSLENIQGIGRRFYISNCQGFSSLFRPDWKIIHE